MQPPQPTAEHRWLSKLAGQWKVVSSTMMAPPGVTLDEYSGSEKVRMLGDIWMVSEGEGRHGNTPPMQSLMVLGYDEKNGSFIGSFYHGMTTHLWTYERGELNAERTKLTLHAEGPGMEPGKFAKYHDIIEFTDNDHRSLRSEMLQDDGSWMEFMSIQYERV